MFLLLATAFAADVLVYAPNGVPAAGESGEWEVVVVEAGKTSEKPVSVTAAGVLEVLASPPGRHRYRYTPPPGVTEASFAVQLEGEPLVRRVIPLPLPPPPTLGAAAEVESAVGTSRVELRFPRTGVGAAQGMLARASEGRILEVRGEADGVVVALEPGADRQARVVAVALVDTDDPHASPAFGLIRMRARPQLSLTTEPGNQVTVRVGRRSYGPFVADGSGTASLVFDAMPGETTYEVTVVDDLGNTQRSTGPLPTSGRPVLVGVESVEASGAVDLWMAAWSATGTPWAGAAPACQSGVPMQGDAQVIGKGLFHRTFEAPDSAVLFEPRVECTLGEASLALRLPGRAQVPGQIELRVYPETLSADFPIAQVQVALLDERGQRLPADSLVVKAEFGELELEKVDGVLRGEYRGQAAVEHGADTLVATWEQPPGEGRLWSLDAELTRVEGVDGPTLEVRARARDQRGRPLAGARLTIELGALVQAVTTDARGTAVGRFLALPAAATVVTVRASDGATRNVLWLPAEPLAEVDPHGPDLEARVNLPIQAGRVRQVFLDVSPRPLITGSGSTGTVVIRMLDWAGNPVADEAVTVEASAGVMGTPVAQADGTFSARYDPPPTLAEQTVRITAHTTAGEVATDLLLTPRPVHGGLSVSVGWISNFGVVSAPTLSLTGYNRLPFLPRIFGARVGVTVYTLETTVHDASADSDIDVFATWMPIDVGLVVTERWGRQSLQAGLAAVIAPYALAVDFGGDRGVNGVGMASPGLAVQAGGGYRLGSSELFLEARFLLFTATSSQLAFEGSVGGASLAAGYRLLY